jgi:hypothetical protein
MPLLGSAAKRIERRIEEAVIKDRGHPSLGYGGEPYIRRMRAGHDCGTVDLMILPRLPARHKVILVEAKRANARDVASQVVGQLLMYHTGVLQLGSAGLDYLRRYAERPDKPEFRTFVPAQEVCPPQPNGKRLSKADAWRTMQDGKRLEPSEIGLFVALSGPPKRSLCQILDRLYQSYCLEIGIIVTDVTGRKRDVVEVGRPTDSGGLTRFLQRLSN